MSQQNPQIGPERLLVVLLVVVAVAALAQYGPTLLSVQGAGAVAFARFAEYVVVGIAGAAGVILAVSLRV